MTFNIDECVRQIWWDEFFTIGATEISTRIKPDEHAAKSIVDGILTVSGAHDLLRVCEDAADRFDEYAAHHAAKPDPEKAARNKAIANEIRYAISQAKGQP